MRSIFLFLFLGFSIPAGAQKKIAAEQLQKVLIQHEYHCDSFLQKFEQYLQHGDVAMKFTFLSAEQKGDNLLLKGRVVDPIGDGLRTNIYLANISDSLCQMGEIKSQSDQNGQFELSVLAHLQQSIYFTSIGYHDAELKLLDLLGLMK